MTTHVVPQASPDMLPALALSLEPCAPLFRRSTSRASLERSLTGWLTELAHKHGDTSAAAVAGPSTARLPPLCTDAVWAPQTRAQPRVRALGAPRPPDGRRGLDDPGLPPPGRGAVGGPARMPGPWARAPMARASSARPTGRRSRPAAPPCMGPSPRGARCRRPGPPRGRAVPRAASRQRSRCRRSPPAPAPWSSKRGRGASPAPRWSLSPALAPPPPACRASTPGRSLTSWG